MHEVDGPTHLLNRLRVALFRPDAGFGCLQQRVVNAAVDFLRIQTRRGHQLLHLKDGLGACELQRLSEIRYGAATIAQQAADRAALQIDPRSVAAIFGLPNLDRLFATGQGSLELPTQPEEESLIGMIQAVFRIENDIAIDVEQG